MKNRRSSLKKVILTVSMLAVFLIATIVSVVLVLAAQKGAVETSIDIEYVVDGVTAQISANYAIVPNDSSQEILLKEMKTESLETEIVFEPSQKETSAQLLPSEEIVLNTKNQTIVFEYIFENLGDGAFSLQLVETPERENINQTYYVSAIRLDTSEYRTRINTAEEDFHPQAVTEFGQKVYVYVKASIEKAYNQASYDGTFAWAMLNANYVTVNLNNGGGVGKTSLNVIQTSEVSNIDMPTIADVPTVSDMAYIFDGYYSELNGGGIKFINGDGTSASVANVTKGQALYANYIQAFNITDTTITSLTDQGKILQSVTIPNGITTIDSNAFEGSQASVVYIPASVQTISEGAFEGNTVIKRIIVEDGEILAYADDASKLTSIGANAFYGCTNLEYILLPESLKTIGSNAFAECLNLLKIDFCATNMNSLTTTSEVFKNAGSNGRGIVFNVKNNVTIIPNCLFYCASADNAPKVIEVNFEENSSMTIIGNYSFARLANLKEISIPEGSTEIGSYSFIDCSAVNKIKIPSTLTKIGYHAFNGCLKVEEIYVPTLESWMNINFSSEMSSPVKATSKLYVGGEILTDLVIPSSVTEIKNETFVNVKTIKSLTIPEGVTSIGTEAFLKCSGFTSVHIPSSVTYIGERAFRDCKITSVTFAENSQLQTISNLAFYSCQSLTSLTIPKSVTSIGRNIVAVCYSLTSLVVEEGNTVYNSGSAYGDGSETNCIIELATNKIVRGCKGSTIPEGIEIIGDYAFMYSGHAFADFVIPTSVKSIEYQSFFNCTGLKTLTIPSSVTNIDKEAFKNCNSLASVVFVDPSEWFVADSADATSGTDITISSTDFAANATLLRNTYVDKYFIKKEFFILSEDRTTITGLTDEGKAASEIVIPSSITTIGERAFENWGGTSLTISENIVNIADYAFYNCRMLTEINYNAINCADLTRWNYCFGNAGQDSTGITINIGANVTRIPEFIFSPTDNEWLLDYRYDPEHMNTTIISFDQECVCSEIGMGAFANSNILSLTIPSSVTKIGNSAFRDCYNLTSLTIAENVTELGWSSFGYILNLTELNYNVKRLTNTLESAKAIFEGTGHNSSSLVVNIGENVEEIPAYLFATSYQDGSFSPRITSVVLPENSTWIYSEERDSISGTNVDVDSQTLASNLRNSWLSYYLIRKNKESPTSYFVLSEDGTTITGLTDEGKAASEIVVPSTVTTISQGALNNAVAKKIVIPATVKTAGYPFMSGCTNLEILEISADLIKAGDVIFYNYSGLDFLFGEYDADFCEVDEYAPITLSQIVLNSGTQINEGAFASNRYITTIFIPDSVKSIGRDVFAGCDNLVQVKKPVDLKIENEFSKFAEIITLDESFSSTIEIDNKFAIYTNGNKKVLLYVVDKTITNADDIPSDVTNINYRAFNGCNNLVYNTYDNANYLGKGDNPYYVLTEVTSRLITSCQINVNTNIILNDAFNYCSNLTSLIVEEGNTKYNSGSGSNYIIETATNTLIAGLNTTIIPSSVTSIGDYAFYHCSSLTSITIPSSVTSIGDCAFSNCSGLTSITIPSSVTSIGNSAFSNCSGLTTITIPSSVTGIGNYAFHGCSNLTGITIPSSVTIIGNSAFYGCSKLTSITIPSSVTSIGSDTFHGCSNLKSVTFAENSNLSVIGGGAFSDCKGLTSISIPSSVTNIREEAFYNCGGLTQVHISSIESWLNITFYNPSSNPLYNGGILYINNIEQTEIEIPNTITKINDYAFSGYKNLTSVSLPSSVTSIGSYAFQNCRSLTSITIPSSVTSIEDNAFCYCSVLTNVIFETNSQLTSIGSYAFQNCSNLTGITIPSSVTSIGSSAFSNCSGLTSITIPSSVTIIGDYAFSYCSSLTSITIPSSVTSIGSSAFEGCKNLTSVTFAEGSQLTSIGSYAFYGCTALTEINYNATKLTSALSSSNNIFYNAGKNGTGITVNIGESVKEIPAYLFYVTYSSYRPNITSVVLPSGSTWVYSETKGTITENEVTVDATTLATNLKDTWKTYYLIRTDN